MSNDRRGFAESLDLPEMPPRKRIEPTYYVQHPDGSHSVADPQPSLQRQEFFQFKARENARIIRKMRAESLSGATDRRSDGHKWECEYQPKNAEYDAIECNLNCEAPSLEKAQGSEPSLQEGLRK